MKSQSSCRIVVASPTDVASERELADQVIREVDDTVAPQLELTLSSFRWELDSFPAFHPLGAQGAIDPLIDIASCDILVLILWSRLGTQGQDGLTGTEHEFRIAYESWRQTKRPEIMAYFNTAAVKATVVEQAQQLERVLAFKARFPKEALYWEYDGPSAFQEQFRRHLVKTLFRLPKTPAQHAAVPRVFSHDLAVEDVAMLKVENSSATDEPYSSFWTDGARHEFRRLRLPTTPGWIRDQGVERQRENVVYLVRDPIRPFEIQIGELRASRPGGDPGWISLGAGMSPKTFDSMYPFIVDEPHKWLRIVLAELEANPAVLERIWKDDPDDQVRKVVARNPSAPNAVKKEDCLFCSAAFMAKRREYVNSGAQVMANDYPYGPYFHYIVMPKDEVHSWDSVEERHLFDMNRAIKELLDPTTDGGRDRLRNAAGVRVGLNSSVRHLVLGRTTRASAGASVSHVHKQVWGMAPGSVNLADHLARICEAYASRGVDYLGAYLQALKEAGLILWDNEHVALYVPLGQISMHELQVMVKRPNRNNYLELDKSEIRSFSRAEFIATQLYKELGINSFNEIVLSRQLSSKSAINFRVIATFITREIDLAVSELSLLYVVDKHPTDTLIAAAEHLPAILAKLPQQSG